MAGLTKEQFLKERKERAEGNTSTLFSASNKMSKEEFLKERSRRKDYSTYMFDTLGDDEQTARNALFNSYNNWQDADTLASNKATVQSMADRLKAYQNYNDSDDLRSIIGYYDNALSNWDKMASVYGNYRNADAYNKANDYAKYDSAYSGKSYDEIHKAKGRAYDANEIEYLRDFTNYGDEESFEKAIANASDDDYRKKLEGAYQNYKDANAWSNYEGILQNSDIDSTIGELSGWLDKELSQTYTIYDAMTDDEKKVAKYLFLNNTDNVLDHNNNEFAKYMKDMNMLVGKRDYEEKTSNDLEKIENGGALTNLLMSARNSIVNATASLPSTFEMVLNNATGYGYNPYIASAGLINRAAETTSAISEEIKNATAPVLSDTQFNIASMAYNAVVSDLSSKAGQLLLGGAYTPFMSGSAYATTYKDALDRGLDRNSANATALAAGAAEVVFEYVSLGELKALQTEGTDGIKTALLNMAKQFVGEGSEEVATDIANMASDYIINGDMSEISNAYQSYINAGYSKEEAFKKTTLSKVGDVLESFIVGGMSGAMGAGMMSAKGYAQNKQTGANADRYLLEKTISGNEDLESRYKEANTDAKLGKFMNDVASESYESTHSALANYIKANDARVSDMQADRYAKQILNGNINRKNVSYALGSLGNEEYMSLKDKNDKIYQRFNAATRTSEEKLASEKKMEKFSIDNDAEIQNITDIKDNKVTVDGEVKPISEVAMNTEQAIVVDNASMLSDAEKNVYLSVYRGQESEAYDTAFRMVWEDAQSNVPIEDTYEKFKTDALLSEHEIDKIYSASAKVRSEQGAINAKARNEAYAEIKKNFKAGKFDASELDKKNVNLDDPAIKTAYQIAQTFCMLGANVRLIYDISSPNHKAVNGFYTAEDKTITINLAAKYNVNDTIKKGYSINSIAHEFTHFMQDELGKDFDVLTNALKRIYGDTKWNALIKEQMDLFGVKGDEAIAEVVARACEDMLNNPDTMEQILTKMEVNEIKSLKDAVKKFFDKLMELWNKVIKTLDLNSNATAAKMLREEMANYEEIRKMWIDMMAQALKEVQNANDIALKEYVTSTSAEVLDYIENTLNNQKRKRAINIEDSIPSDLVNDIKYLTGVDVSDFGNEMSAETVFHIWKRHGKNGNQDHSMENKADIARIQYAIEHYQKIGNAGYDNYIRDKNDKPSPKVMLQTKIGDSFYYVVEAVPDSKVKKIKVITAYKNKNDVLSQEAVDIIPRQNVRNDLEPSTSSNTIIDGVLLKSKQIDPKNIPAEKYDEMKSHFGTTTNFNVAGYMLKDGTMLDFSGKHWGDTSSTFRQVDHRDVQEVLEDTNKTNGVGSMITMISNGNIRLMPENGGINLSEMPNEAQMKVLERYIQNRLTHDDRMVTVDFDEKGGDTVYSKLYEAGVGVSTQSIIRDIVDYYENGIKSQSTVAQFHNMYSKQIDSSMDKSYAEAVKNGNEVEAKRLIREAAEIAFKDSQARYNKESQGVHKFADSDMGKLREFYHGTNSNEFSVFSKDYTGMSSGDNGFFGEGFYFAYNDGEASYYGKRVIPAFLNTVNPFYVNDELDYYDGKRSTSYGLGDAIYLMNLLEKIPNMVKDVTISGYDNKTDSPVELSVKEFKKIFDDIYNNKEFTSQEMNSAYEGTIYKSFADRESHTYEDAQGKEHTFYDWGYEQTWYNKSDSESQLENTWNYINKVMFTSLDIPRSVVVNMEHNFADEVKAMGYDSIYQSKAGDEVVLFDSSQIKRSDITYDDNGNLIPLSERFKSDNSDIRYSKQINDDSENNGDIQSYSTVNRLSSNRLLHSTYEKVKKLIKNEITDHYQNDISLDFSGIAVADNLLFFYESYDDINPTVLDYVKLSEVVKYAKRDAWILNSFNTYVGQNGIFRGSDREDIIRFAERVGSNAYDRIMHGEQDSKRRGANISKAPSRQLDDTAYEILGEKERVEKDFSRVASDIERLATAINGKNINITKSQIEAAVSSIKKMYQSTYNDEDFKKELTSLYRFIANGASATDILGRAYDIAGNVIANQKSDVTPDFYYRNLLSEIRSTKVSLSKEQIASAVEEYGADYRNSFMGNVILAKNGTPLVEMWKEWSKKYPDIFNADANEADMLIALGKALDSVKQSKLIVESYREQEVRLQLARDIYNKFWNISDVREATKDIYYDHSKVMNEMHKDYTARVEKAMRPSDWKKVVSTVGKQKDKKLADYKEYAKKRKVDEKEAQEKRILIKKITNTSTEMLNWMNTNSKDKHIPDALKPAVKALFDAIDFSSRQMYNSGEPTRKDISFTRALENMHTIVMQSSAELTTEDGFTELDLTSDFAEEIDKLYKAVNEVERSVHEDNAYVLQAMNKDDLERLYTMVKALKTSITQMNKFIASNNNHRMDEVADMTIEHAAGLGQSKLPDAISKFDYGEGLPYYVFQRMGEGGRIVFENLMDGQDKMAFRAREIQKFAEDTYEGKEAVEWEKEIKDFKFRDYEFQMTVPQIMSLYCLMKREQARGHILSGGLRVDKFKNGLKTINQTQTLNLSELEINEIIKTLTDRQLEVADALQKYMNTTCSEWGNEVTMKRFGIKGFTEENYFPIKVNDKKLSGDPKDKNASLYALLNLSFTKKLTIKANNEVMVENVFDVFANHASDMARYNSMALPVLDLIRWWNYKERVNNENGHEDVTVKSALETAYGDEMNKYIRRLIDDINGTKERGRMDSMTGKLFTAYKVAAVGANLQVALLQPISYFRALYKMDGKYLRRALIRKPDINSARENVGMMVWKDMGFFELDVTRGLTSIIKHDGGVMDDIREWSMKPAEMGDTLTWGFIWNACEEEIKDTHKDLAVGSDEFKKAVAKRMRELIYSTQVVDSVLTRSQYMRGGDMYSKMLTAFLSEPTLSLNTLRDAAERFSQDAKRYGRMEAFKRNKKNIYRAVGAYIICSVIESALRSTIGKIRDTDDEEEIQLLFLEHIRDEMNIFNKMPLFKDIISIVQGYSPTRMDESAIQQAVWTFKDVLDGDWDYDTLYKSLKLLSQTSGLPVSNATREVVSIWNFTVGNVNDNLIIK